MTPEPTNLTSARGHDVSRGYGGLRVVAFESRLATETRNLIEKAGGIGILAPSMREVPIEDNPAAHAFADELAAATIDVVFFMTGVGTRYLFEAMETRHPRTALLEALSRVVTVARGPKPVRVLRELGVPITVTVPEPNTWREILTAVTESDAAVELAGTRVAVQEYGVSNERFLEALGEHGAEVLRVPVYRWALPENLAPLNGAIDQILARTADVLLFTSGNQVYNLMQVVRDRGCDDAFRAAATEVVIASVGPVCTEALQAFGLAPDLEPPHSKLGVLVTHTAEHAPALLLAKRRALRAARVSMTSAVAEPHRTVAAHEDSPFLKACRREPVPYTPVWLMRQAGRYMQEYREVRARVPFIDLCKTPELAADVTVTAVRRIGADAAILFSDILLIVEPMGLGLEFAQGEGPALTRVVRGAADVDRLREVEPKESLGFVMEAVRLIRETLDPHIPLIGFSGAPFTLASYVVEGGGSRNYTETKTLMYRDEGAWNAMMALIARAIGKYLAAQVAAGAQAVQLFDSWVGCLSPYDYERYVLPHTRAVIEALPAGVPVIHFGTDTATLLELQVRTGGSVIGVDHRVPIGPVFERFPAQAIQGNLDPVALFTDRKTIRAAVARILAEVGVRPGHIFNLGHGILPGTPVDNVIALVDAVHELSAH